MSATAEITATITEQEERPSLLSRAARRTASYGDSIWEEMAVLFERHPHMIFFGDGSPAKEAMPVDRLREAAVEVWEEAPGPLGYGESAGYPPLRALIAERMTAHGIDAAPETVIVTHGSTQGIEIACKLMLDPGDVVILENPTFLGALQIFNSFEARLAPVPMDLNGMSIDALERTLVAEPRAKIIYTIPTFQNPTGVTMPRERRERLLELARAYNVLVLEDDPYGDLRYSGTPEPPLRALDPSVIYLGTFSKTIAPALRTGWLAAPPELVIPLISAREAADIHNDRMTMRLVYCTAKDFLDDHLVTARDLYRGRRDAMLAGLTANMPEGVHWSEPDGGFFVWVILPDGASTLDLLTVAADHGVLFFPGVWFYPNQDRTHALRLSFSTVNEIAIAEGTRRLGVAMRAYLEDAPPAPQ